MSAYRATNNQRNGGPRRDLSAAMGQRPAPLQFGHAKAAGLGEQNPDLIKQEINSNKALTGEGYQQVIYNLLFLLQTRIARQYKGMQLMDENLFRTYFKKLYRSVVRMESTILAMLGPDERDGFVTYSSGLHELASYFKIDREVNPNKKIPANKKEKNQLTQSMIFGVGEIPKFQKTCRVVPSSLQGFLACTAGQSGERRKEKNYSPKVRAAGSDSATPRNDQDEQMFQSAKNAKGATRAQSADPQNKNKMKKASQATISSTGAAGAAGHGNQEVQPSPSADIHKNTRKKKNKLPYQEKLEDAPDNKEGERIPTSDNQKQAPRDFLLIGRVQKKGTRPMCVGEIQHRDRENQINKLDAEIRGLQKVADYERAVNDQVQDLPQQEMTGPMMIALKELKKRLSLDREYM